MIHDSKETVIWGVGNPLYGDDGAGVRLAERLQRLAPAGMEVQICETVPENYLAPLRKAPPALLLVVDAADMGLPAGTVRRTTTPGCAGAPWSSHGIGLPQLLATLDGTTDIWYIGIQPRSTELSLELTDAVAASVGDLSATLAAGRWESIPLLYQENRSPR
ncbi:MAG: hydrogenase maturation protease [Synergistales bacterium]|nr:hydrogenase maturation protease [Synergistales bacterium]